MKACDKDQSCRRIRTDRTTLAAAVPASPVRGRRPLRLVEASQAVGEPIAATRFCRQPRRCPAPRTGG